MLERTIIRKKIDKNLDIFLSHDIFKNCIVMCPEDLKLQVGSCVADYINHHSRSTRLWKVKPHKFNTRDGTPWHADEIVKAYRKEDAEFLQTMNVIIFDEMEDAE